MYNTFLFSGMFSTTFGLLLSKIVIDQDYCITTYLWSAWRHHVLVDRYVRVSFHQTTTTSSLSLPILFSPTDGRKLLLNFIFFSLLGMKFRHHWAEHHLIIIIIIIIITIHSQDILKGELFLWKDIFFLSFFLTSLFQDKLKMKKRKSCIFFFLAKSEKEWWE